LFSRDAKRSAEDLFRRDARAERDRRQNYFGSPKRQQGRPCKRFRFAHLACFRGLLTFFRRQDISFRYVDKSLATWCQGFLQALVCIFLPACRCSGSLHPGQNVRILGAIRKRVHVACIGYGNTAWRKRPVRILWRNHHACAVSTTRLRSLSDTKDKECAQSSLRNQKT